MWDETSVPGSVDKPGRQASPFGRPSARGLRQGVGGGGRGRFDRSAFLPLRAEAMGRSRIGGPVPDARTPPLMRVPRRGASSTDYRAVRRIEASHNRAPVRRRARQTRNTADAQPTALIVNPATSTGSHRPGVPSQKN